MLYISNITSSFDHKGEVSGSGVKAALKYPKFTFDYAFKMGDKFATEAGVGGPIPGSTDCADSNVGQTGDSSSDGFITKYSSLGQQGWVQNSENAAADNNVGILTIDDEGMIHVAVAFQTSVTLGSDTHQTTGQNSFFFQTLLLSSHLRLRNQMYRFYRLQHRAKLTN